MNLSSGTIAFSLLFTDNMSSLYSILYLESICVNHTACWFWTGATTPLSLQSNLAGSPSVFSPEKRGTLWALARRYRSVDSRYSSKSFLDTKTHVGRFISAIQRVRCSPDKYIKSDRPDRASSSARPSSANFTQLYKPTSEFLLWEVRELVDAILGRLWWCGERIQARMPICSILQ